jgi:hypothetical protein
MALQGFNTNNYSGEFQEHVLTLAATGNELVERGLIHVIPQILDSINIPRIKTGQMLQKRKAHPRFDPENAANSDAKGDFTYSEQKLVPHDMMVYTAFLPKVFEHIWRPYQPTGNLVFQELPSKIQSVLIAELLKQVQHELGYQYINGEYQDGNNDQLLMNGILTQAAKDGDVVRVATAATTITGRLKELRKKIPVTMRRNPNLRILMSVEDFDAYDDELTARESKNADETDVNRKRYKGITIEDLTDWPQGLMVATICSSGTDGNLFAAVSLANDEYVIRIEQMSNGSEYYYFKMLMKGDTNIGFGEEFIALDWREEGAFAGEFEPFITAEPDTLTFPAEGGSLTVEIDASGEYTIGEVPSGFSAVKNGNGLLVTAADNSEGQSAKSGTLTVSLSDNEEVSVDIELNQPIEG